jgi:hypothetical protein
MYASLDKLDILADTPERPLVVQTDHRSAEEIDAERDLSIVFAAIRARNARLAKPESGVRFSFLHAPPAWMITLLQQLDAEVEAGVNETLHAEAPDLEAARVEVEAAWLRLGEGLFAEFGLPRTLDALRQIEATLQAQVDGGSDGDDPVGWWTAVVRLGGAAARLLTDRRVGTLHVEDELNGPIPFRWTVGTGLINLLARAGSFLGEDPNVAPSSLVTLAMQSEEDGRTMYNLRPPGWGGEALSLMAPLFGGEGSADATFDEAPLVALVTDLPTATRTISKDTPPERAELLKAEALANLRAEPYEIAELDLGVKVLLVSGGYFAAEHLLDPEFMQGLHTRLGSELLLAAAPRKGVLFVQSGLVAAEHAGALSQLVRTQHAEAAPSERLSPAVLVVSEGRVVGMAKVTPTAPVEAKPKPKKSFWQRWFGGGEA